MTSRRATGATNSNGTPHMQPTLLRRVWCIAFNNGHYEKFSAHPRGSCIYCGWWPQATSGKAEPTRK